MTTFASSVAPRPRMIRSYSVAEIMTPNPLAFEKQMPIPKAFALLQFNQLDAAPVVDERGCLAGIVTSTSCAAWEEFSLRSSPHGFVPKELDMTAVWEISSPGVESVRADASADEAIDRLAERRVRRIYVVNNRDELVGVVSMADLIRHLTERASRPRVSKAGAAQLC
jgi:CBS-domain-containing membrane protein